MIILVVGASGATGQLLVTQLLNRGEKVKAIVRTMSDLPETITKHENISVIRANVLDINDAELAKHVQGCNAIASCLGHNMSFRGVFGQPRRLVTDATRRLCDAIKVNNPNDAVKFVLMNTTGNRNQNISEPISFAQKCIISLLRLLIPPHVDNEKAAEYLRTEIGQKNSVIEWAVVRPDGLIDECEVTEYKIHPSPTRSAIFDAGTTSRINVGHFMADLITEHDTWSKWKGKMPVIYNVRASSLILMHLAG